MFPMQWVQTLFGQALPQQGVLFRLRKLAIGSMWGIEFSIFLPFQSFTFVLSLAKPSQSRSTCSYTFLKNPICFPSAIAYHFLGTGRVF